MRFYGARLNLWATLVVVVVLSLFWSGAAYAQTPSVAYSATGGAVSAVAPTGPDSTFTRLIYGKTAGATGEVLGTDSTFSALLQRPLNLGDVAIQDRVAATRIGTGAADLALIR